MFPGRGRQPIASVQRRRVLTAKHHGYASSGSIATWLGLALLAVIIAATHSLLPSKTTRHPEQKFDSDREIGILHHEPSKEFCTLPRRPLVCAHGGDADAAPPNTLLGFAAALDGGADCVEVDVSMTKDGHLVALHDRDLAALLRTSGAAAGLLSPTEQPHRRNLLEVFSMRKKSHAAPRASDYTWEELQRLDWSPKAGGVVEFHTVLSMVVPRGAAVTVDVKLRKDGSDPGEVEEMVDAVLGALRGSGCGSACMVWAKSDWVAEFMKARDPRQRVGIVATNATETAREVGMADPLRLQSLRPEVVGLHYEMATPELADQLRRARREIHVWTANTAAMMKMALDAGPDAVVTSHPKKLVEALDARRLACEQRRRRGV